MHASTLTQSLFPSRPALLDLVAGTCTRLTTYFCENVLASFGKGQCDVRALTFLLCAGQSELWSCGLHGAPRLVLTVWCPRLPHNQGEDTPLTNRYPPPPPPLPFVPLRARLAAWPTRAYQFVGLFLLCSASPYGIAFSTKLCCHSSAEALSKALFAHALPPTHLMRLSHVRQTSTCMNLGTYPLAVLWGLQEQSRGLQRWTRLLLVFYFCNQQVRAHSYSSSHSSSHCMHLCVQVRKSVHVCGRVCVCVLMCVFVCVHVCD